MTMLEILFGVVIPLVIIPYIAWKISDFEEIIIRYKIKNRIYPYDQVFKESESK